jgi:plasmid maintenance system antidote protein VapI
MEVAPHSELTPTALSRAVDISVPYASQILKGVRTPTQSMAIRIYRATGKKFGPIMEATDAEIDVLERFQGAA